MQLELLWDAVFQANLDAFSAQLANGQFAAQQPAVKRAQHWSGLLVRDGGAMLVHSNRRVAGETGSENLVVWRFDDAGAAVEDDIVFRAIDDRTNRLVVAGVVLRARSV